MLFRSRAFQLPDANVASYFLKTFGRADRLQTCECERTEEPSMAQALHIANGDTINQKLAAKDNAIAKLLADKLTNEQILDEAFLSTLARPPTATEKTRSLKLLADAGKKVWGCPVHALSAIQLRLWPRLYKLTPARCLARRRQNWLKRKSRTTLWLCAALRRKCNAMSVSWIKPMPLDRKSTRLNSSH